MVMLTLCQSRYSRGTILQYRSVPPTSITLTQPHSRETASIKRRNGSMRFNLSFHLSDRSFSQPNTSCAKRLWIDSIPLST
jgi:hypothetical protein